MHLKLSSAIREESDPEVISNLLRKGWQETDLPPVSEAGPPVSITPRQMRLALLRAGILPAVEAALSQAGPEAQIEWAHSLEFRREHPLVISMGAALGFDDAGLDSFFTTASLI